MMCIPRGVGLSSIAFEKKKTIYMPTFDRGKTIDYSNETDNIRSVPEVKDLMFGPMIGHSLDSNGLIQCINCKGVLTKNVARKFRAMQKFLGSRLSSVEVRAAMFQVHAALQMT